MEKVSLFPARYRITEKSFLSLRFLDSRHKASVSEQQSRQPDLGTRVFNGPFAIVWALFLFLLFGFVGTPVANALIVCWVRGPQAYLHEGIRIVKGRPLKFSDGMSVPAFPEYVTFFVLFFVVVFGLSYLLLFLLRVYERRFKKTDAV